MFFGLVGDADERQYDSLPQWYSSEAADPSQGDWRKCDGGVPECSPVKDIDTWANVDVLPPHYRLCVRGQHKNGLCILRFIMSANMVHVAVEESKSRADDCAFFQHVSAFTQTISAVVLAAARAGGGVSWSCRLFLSLSWASI